MVEHVNITDPNLHEPKGAAAASANQMLVANGTGGTSWKNTVNYACIFTTGSDVQTIGSIGTTVQTMSFVNNGPNSISTSDQANNRLVISGTGDYLLNFTCSFRTVATGDSGIYDFHIRVNGVDSVIEVYRDMSGTSDRGSITCSGLLALTDGDLITVDIGSDNGGNTDDVSIQYATLYAILLKAS